MKGKTKLVPLVPVLIHDILLNEERGIPLKIEVSLSSIAPKYTGEPKQETQPCLPVHLSL